MLHQGDGYESRGVSHFCTLRSVRYRIKLAVTQTVWVNRKNIQFFLLNFHFFHLTNLHTLWIYIQDGTISLSLPILKLIGPQPTLLVFAFIVLVEPIVGREAQQWLIFRHLFTTKNKDRPCWYCGRFTMNGKLSKINCNLFNFNTYNLWGKEIIRS